jgi:extracellular elastinolytic metalloproteinase
MKRLFQRLLMGTLSLMLMSGSMMAQNAEQTKKPHPDAVNIALRYLENQQKAWNLTAEDVRNVRVQDYYSTEANGVTHVYILQENAHIELFNGLVNVNVLPSGEVLYAGNRFMRDFASTVNATQPQLTPEAAIKAACEALKVPITEGVTLKNTVSKTEFVFDKGKFVLSDINVKLKYQKVNDQTARLAWDLNIDQPDGQDHWSVRIDALTGEVLEKNSLTVHCNIEHGRFGRADAVCTDENHVHTEGSFSELKIKNSELKNMTGTTSTATAATVVGGGSYNVFALPAESPNHGNRSIVLDPADSLASPYGWHDTNGAVGAEYTITRGNNVWAFLDLTNTNTSSGDEPNGGATLTFNDYFSKTAEPDSIKQAATTNLFYVNNMIHDITFRYGFDEAAGNFQVKNYSGQGNGNDAVLAQAQDSYGVTATNTNRSNANFSTPPDGTRGVMQMYVWTGTGSTALAHVTAPAPLISDLATGAGQFGATIGTTPVTAPAVFVNDGTSKPTLGCGAAIQTNLTGKIALIERGDCEFGYKALKAQQRGAVGVVICLLDNTLVGLLGGTNGAQVTIPVVSIAKADVDRIRAAANDGSLILSLYSQAALVPKEIDGDFDNGVVIHEYMHGISNRLTGGRLNSACLTNEEHGGEGWSDFLSLALTARPSDRGTTVRGIGTFASRQATTGRGIRNDPYSTNLASSPHTYDDLTFTTEIHNVGEVWCAALWDMYWAMSDLYGWDANLKNVNSGNGRAIRLVIDGMKLQPCNPGFLDARDAVLAADRANFGGANQCLIWDVFARRGMGYNASQGLNTKSTDNTESLDKNPYCTKTLKILKSAPDFIKAGDQITYTIEVINHKGVAASNIIVTDEIPASATFVAGSANRAVTQSGQNLNFTIASMNHNDTVRITYKVVTDPNKKSIAQFMDNFELGDGKWDFEGTKNFNYWQIQTLYARSGTKAFGVDYPSSPGASDQAIKLLQPIVVRGTKPILNFYHRYDTEKRFDGGILQVTTDNGTTWRDLGDKSFKNPYGQGKFEYTVFGVANQKAWNGILPTYTPVAVDLSSFIGQTINFRFRFGTDSLVAKEGWFVDDVAVMDMFNYDTRVRVSSAQGDTASAGVLGRGTIVEPTLSTPTSDITEGAQLRLFPNPASDFLNINLLLREPATEATISIVSVDGRMVWQQNANLTGSKELLLPVNMATFASGIYFVKVRTNEKTLVEKVVKR